jgi:hypothetical protein
LLDAEFTGYASGSSAAHTEPAGEKCHHRRRYRR